MRTPLFYGLMTGLAIAAWMLIEYLAGFHESDVGKCSGFAALVLAALGVYLSIKSYRRLQGGYMRYGRGVYIGFLTSIYAGIVVAAFTYLYYEFINPDFP
ncbi:MAG: DUF4199 domain-containing protein, partial [Hymenobacteraceae bacterium]|nr:DUF4199 domain-containing protein [Hymenobacteraceae bacterium]MDX5395564.1 DUF4199 domain-containing protein [Hymenobacteraceae bacterium]MDX5511618.1 DUF4199 domain-containing protein [Hymenobacteraceae bacterium]